MKNRVLLYLAILALVISCGLGTSQSNEFYIEARELVSLIEDVESHQYRFVKKWSLSECSTNSGKQYFCSSDNKITFDRTPDGFIIGLNELGLKNYPQLVAELSKTHETWTEEEEREAIENMLDENIIELKVFYKGNYELMIGKSKKDGVISYSLVGNKEQ